MQVQLQGAGFARGIDGPICGAGLSVPGTTKERPCSSSCPMQGCGVLWAPLVLARHGGEFYSL